MKRGLLLLAALAAACGGGTPTGGGDQTPAQLVFLDLIEVTVEGLTFPSAIRVELRTAAGTRVTNATSIPVILTLGTNTAGGVLSGNATASAVAGVATFSGLAIDKPGRYTIVARYGTLPQISSPEFPVTRNFVSLSPNDQHTCGITAAGETFCWGSNSVGQLGDGTVTGRILPVRVAEPAGIDFTSVSAGLSSFTCGRSTAGDPYCWGGNESGQNGNPSGSLETSPRKVILPAGSGIVAIDAGYNRACVVVTLGGAYCWGGGSAAVVPIAQPVGLVLVSISSGLHASCARDAAGNGWCWGPNGSGQLGDGTQIDRPGATRVAAPAGVTFATIQTGGPNACGLSTAGVVYCWGDGDRGQLGDGTQTMRITPTPVQAPAGVTFSRLSVGLEYACAIATSGTTYCWGNGGSFLGVGDGNRRVVPSPVLTPTGVTFAEIFAGFSHTCAISTAHVAYCWGEDGQGQLGDGSPGTRNVPGLVMP